jgi:hypothetical protein
MKRESLDARQCSSQASQLWLLNMGCTLMIILEIHVEYIETIHGRKWGLKILQRSHYFYWIVSVSSYMKYLIDKR